MSKPPILKKEYILKKYLIIGLFFGISASFPLSAANVSVLVIETGQSAIISLNSQYTFLWENNLMEVLFESGHIVSNAPIMRLDEKPNDGFPDEAERDYESAKTGGMDYFWVVIVDYTKADVTLRLFTTASQEMIREQRYAIRTFKNIKDEVDNIQKAIEAMAAYLR